MKRKRDPFKDERYQRDLLYKELLEKHQLELSIPMNQLIPTYNSRLYYINYLHSKLSGHQKGLDIGVGTSCIYPLLGSRLYDWEFIGTEIDSDSIYYATENIKRNNLESKIQLIKVDEKDIIFPQGIKVDFTMCNPPFYTSLEQIEESRKKKVKEPGGICTGTSNEMITEGGEVSFITRMIYQSKTFPAKLFTTLVGFKKSVDLVCKVLDKEDVSYDVHSFCIGKTWRSIISWTWSSSSN